MSAKVKVRTLEHRYPESISELRRAYDLSGGDQTNLADLAFVEMNAGNRAEALRLLDRLRNPPPSNYASPMLPASVYAVLGDRRNMFAMLREAERQHSSGLMELAVRPQYDAFRTDPEFIALLARLGLPH